MSILISIVAATASTMPPQDPGPGISLELARARKATISDVSYDLWFRLAEDSDEVEGEVRIIYSLPGPYDPTEPVVLDFAGDDLEVIHINGVTGRRPLAVVRDHIVLGPDDLTAGINTFAARFKSKVAATGTPLTKYVDATDGREYLYTLLVPSDAHRLFPCFDQPDLKARFRLRLTVPPKWVAVANGDESNDPARASLPDFPRRRTDGNLDFTFVETAPLSTYLFAFAAGPFEVASGPLLGDGDGARPLRLFYRANRRADVDSKLVFRMHMDCVGQLERYFDSPYPFGKLDAVLVPGFPYGGMEHAGAIFYRETAIAFDHAPTESERIRRSTLIYHEVSHQWFGNLVTMRWFDDLWLKEGFATFVGYRVLESLEPDKNAWLRFHQRVKPRAYAVDSTAGTTPIYQELENLADAKSAYGAIVYNKAPAVLRELEARLGETQFRNGIRLFLRRHAYDNASWEELLDAFRNASRMRGTAWSDRWILTPGMPTVRAVWTVGDDDAIESFSIVQRGSKGSEDVTWPLVLDVLVIAKDGERTRHRVEFAGERAELPDLVGRPAPACVLLNPADVAYGLFLVDERSRDYLLEELPELDDLLLRAVALSAVYASVREAELAPADYADLAIRMLRKERDPESHARLLGTLGTTLSRYLQPEIARTKTAAAADLLFEQLQDGLPGLELQTFRFLVRHCPTTDARALIRAVLDGELEFPGLELGVRDRFLAAASLLAAGDKEAIAREKARVEPGTDVAREIYVSEAAAADAETKQRYFASYLELGEPPEQWMAQSLDHFHWPGQSELTLPYLRPALERVEWVKQHRRIFFMPSWLDAFINGHDSREALEIVRAFLDERADLSIDIRRKILQSLDGLERTVRIREKRQ